MVLRGRRSVPGPTNRTAPIVRAIRRPSPPCPTGARRGHRPARRRADPSPARARRPRLGADRPGPARTTAPGAAPGAPPRRRPGRARTARRAATGAARPRGPASRGRRDADAGDVPRPDRPRPAPRHRRHVPGRRDPARRPVGQRPRVARGGAAPAGTPRRCRRSAATSWRALIEFIEGERPSASVLVVVVERSGGRPLVAEELLAARRELPTVSLTASFEDLVLARVAVRSRSAAASCACWRRPAGRCRATSSPRSPRRSRWSHQRPAALVERPASRRRRPRRRPRGRAGRGASSTASSSRPTTAWSCATSWSAGPSKATCCPSARIRHHAAIATALADDPFVAMHH